MSICKTSEDCLCLSMDFIQFWLGYLKIYIFIVHIVSIYVEDLPRDTSQEQGPLHEMQTQNKKCLLQRLQIQDILSTCMGLTALADADADADRWQLSLPLLIPGLDTWEARCWKIHLSWAGASSSPDVVKTNHTAAAKSRGLGARRQRCVNTAWLLQPGAGQSLAVPRGCASWVSATSGSPTLNPGT